MGEFLTRVYRKGVLETEGFPIEEVSDQLERSDTFVWIDVSAPSKAQLHEVSQELGLHELAVEDALGPHQRPKLDHYETHLFLSCHAVSVDTDDGRLDETEVDAFINQRWLVTVRENDRFPIDAVLRRCDRSPDLGMYGVSYLLYGLLDVVVDGYFDAIEAFDDYYDEVSEGIFAEQALDPRRQRHWFEMRRIMVRFHRLVVPLREAVSSLMRREHAVVPEYLYPYYQDVYDHILRVSESSDSLRDLVSTIVETNLSLRDYRQNLVVKKVGSWAAIITVPAVITGYYGMNVPYPGSGNTWGVVVSTALIVVVSIGLYTVFRERDWL
jgi:magnesium transporter